MARKVKGSSGAAHDLFERLGALARAEEPPDPIAWIEAHRRLSPESSREVGPFRFVFSALVVFRPFGDRLQHFDDGSSLHLFSGGVGFSRVEVL